MPKADEIRKLKAASSEKRALVGLQVSYGYFFQSWLGRLRFHIFLREERGVAHHDHPWSFTTFPLRSYVETVFDRTTGQVFRQVVPRFRRTRRPAVYVHRVEGLWAGTGTDVKGGWVPTLVWRGRTERAWNYWRVDGKRPHKFPWQRYINYMEDHPPSEVEKV